MNSIGGLPITQRLDEWDATHYEWQKSYAHCYTRLNSLQFFFETYITFDVETNYTSRIIEVIPLFDPFNSRLFDKNLTRSEKLKAENEYRDKMKQMLNFLDRSSNSQISGDFDELIIFENKLWNAMNSKTNKTDLTRRVTIYQMENNFPYMNWLQIFRQMFEKTDIVITEDEPILVYDIYYFNALSIILSETSKRTIANYIGLKILSSYGVNMIPKLREMCVAFV
ncbi:membrane metallo-endopeptidase-like 1-like protein [Leptotrombidium deliense]|uniref:Membrane metallo-endopeptidase-like 1-like protein n=1 Tax=Leptotrombidium deliense TaxID=299467 RepID=A0A443S5M6_9ACAR|nr:membrane metallo-endopeptidase-like 1-like protein [Leptotrombidium deliense]